MWQLRQPALKGDGRIGRAGNHYERQGVGWAAGLSEVERQACAKNGKSGEMIGRVTREPQGQNAASRRADQKDFARVGYALRGEFGDEVMNEELIVAGCRSGRLSPMSGQRVRIDEHYPRRSSQFVKAGRAIEVDSPGPTGPENDDQRPARLLETVVFDQDGGALDAG